MSDTTDASGQNNPPNQSTKWTAKPARPSVPIYYDMTHKQRGIALVLNHYEIKGQPKREGTHIDGKRVQAELEALSFKVIVEDDLTLKAIDTTLSSIAAMDHSESDCLVIVVMSHGKSPDYIYAKDHKYKVDTLWEPFMGEKCPSLVGKPKLFFIQACRGTKLDEGVQVMKNTMMRMAMDHVDANADEPMFKIPSMADFLVMYSTYDDHFAFRNPNTGSWFIESLCNELHENGNIQDILNLLTGVIRRVAYHYQSNVPQNSKLDQKKQCPMFVSMLTKTLYFTPKLNE